LTPIKKVQQEACFTLMKCQSSSFHFDILKHIFGAQILVTGSPSLLHGSAKWLGKMAFALAELVRHGAKL
jgi:hypothetical protein